MPYILLSITILSLLAVFLLCKSCRPVVEHYHDIELVNDLAYAKQAVKTEKKLNKINKYSRTK